MAERLSMAEIGPVHGQHVRLGRFTKALTASIRTYRAVRSVRRAPVHVRPPRIDASMHCGQAMSVPETIITGLPARHVVAVLRLAVATRSAEPSLYLDTVARQQ